MKPTSRHSMLLEYLRAIELNAANARCVLEVTQPSTIECSVRRIDPSTGSLIPKLSRRLKRRSRKAARHA